MLLPPPPPCIGAEPLPPAVQLAQLHNKVEFFVESLGSEGSAEQLQSIAE